MKSVIAITPEEKPSWPRLMRSKVTGRVYLCTGEIVVTCVYDMYGEDLGFHTSSLSFSASSQFEPFHGEVTLSG